MLVDDGTSVEYDEPLLGFRSKGVRLGGPLGLISAAPDDVGFLLASGIGCEDVPEVGDEADSEAGIVGTTEIVVPGAITRYSVVVIKTVCCPFELLTPRLALGDAVTVTVMKRSFPER